MNSGFLFKLLGLTLSIIGLILICNALHLTDGFVAFVWSSLIFMNIITVLVYLIMLRALAMKAHSNFVAAFGTGFAIKSVASLGFICYFIFFQPIKDTNFIFPFFFMYFAYTGLLVWDIWQASKKKPLP
jgi:hypothetical protein